MPRGKLFPSGPPAWSYCYKKYCLRRNTFYKTLWSAFVHCFFSFVRALVVTALHKPFAFETSKIDWFYFILFRLSTVVLYMISHWGCHQIWIVIIYFRQSIIFLHGFEITPSTKRNSVLIRSLDFSHPSCIH